MSAQPDRQYALRSLHGLVCIGAKIEHQLRRERRIGAHRRDRVFNLGADLYARGSQGGEEIESIGDDAAQIDE